jgi:hypothetical protein
MISPHVEKYIATENQTASLSFLAVVFRWDGIKSALFFCLGHPDQDLSIKPSE